MNNRHVLEGKVAIVTGAAMGMGEATAKLFAEAKAKVIIADFNEEKGRQVTDEINAAGGEAAFCKSRYFEFRRCTSNGSVYG